MSALRAVWAYIKRAEREGSERGLRHRRAIERRFHGAAERQDSA